MTKNKIGPSFKHWVTASIVTSTIAMGSGFASDNSSLGFNKIGTPNFENDLELIVKFDSNSGLSKAGIESKLAAFNKANGVNLKLKRQLATGAQLVSFEQAGAFKKSDFVNMLSKRSDVVYAVPNYRMYSMATPNDSRYGEQWHYFESTAGINAEPAWDITEGQGAVVAVIDTGYRPHADLAANIVGGYDFISSADTARDGDGRDADASDEGDWFGFFDCGAFRSQNSSWHGTHVAGTIAAVSNNGEGVAGIASKAKVVPVRVLGKCGGTLADIQEGMLWAAGIDVPGVPSNQNPAKVLNMSLGGGAACDAAMQDAVNQITAAGSLVVAAAGNSNADASGFTPASCDNVLTVAAVGRTGGKASYSNFGATVEVSAPGGEMSSGAANGVLSTLNSGTQRPENDTYAFYQGTSMAAPHAAGVAALMYSKKPSATPAEISQVLMDTARGFGAACNQCGTGIIDAHAALLALDGDANVPPTPDFSYSANGLTVDFTDQSSDRDGSVVAWAWDFGDRESSSEQNPSHTFAEAGTFIVSLTVTDDDGASAEYIDEVVVEDGGSENIPPTAAFSFSARDLVVRFTDESSDSDGDIRGYSWNFGDGNSSTDSDPTHEFAEAGTYTVTLTVTDDDGASASSSQQVTVEAPPGGGDITLSASVDSFWIIHTINLSWSDASGDNVDIYRNGSRLATTANDGSWSERRWFSGSGTYRVCDAGTDNCSNEVTVSY
ncbi:MAG: S8 family serine peptidase [Gammaproteobacteria bacterium]|nr:S8 family serine peptidase [Gammaproteobacteria bacterium]